MLWETGKANVIKQEATHCTFDNQTCYQAKSVPVIFDTSSNIGYKTGGMNLTVRGYGFTTGEVKATVDGQNCTVTNVYDQSFSCIVTPKENVSDPNITTYVGSNGVRRQFINETNWLNWNSYDNYNYTESLSMNFETPYYVGDRIGNVMKGWFVAPATTNYRFYIACDDYCSFSIGNTSG